MSECVCGDYHKNKVKLLSHEGGILQLTQQIQLLYFLLLQESFLMWLLKEVESSLNVSPTDAEIRLPALFPVGFLPFVQSG